MPNERNHTIEYILIAIMAVVVMGAMVYVSNTADSYEYAQRLTEKGLVVGKDTDFIVLYQITESRYERGEHIEYTESTPKYLMYGLLINFVWIAMVSEKLKKKYAQERMYGDAEWGSVKQFKKLRAKRRKFYFTDYPPFRYVFHVYIYIKIFKKVWRGGDER